MEVGTGPSTFIPHGLVSKWQLEVPYREAKRNVDPKTGHASKEHYTVSYFEDLFAKMIFNHDDFSINQQISGVPKPGAEKACDIVIKHFSPAQGRKLLCFAECKRRRNTSPSRLVDLEEQARGYCIDFLDDNPQIPRAFACTLVGVWICTWYMSRERNVLVPLLPGGTTKRGDFRNYKDTGLNENAGVIMASFQKMIQASQSGLAHSLPAYVGPTDREIQTKAFYGEREPSPADVISRQVKLERDQHDNGQVILWFYTNDEKTKTLQTAPKDWETAQRQVGNKWYNVKQYITPDKRRFWTTDLNMFPKRPRAPR